MLKVSHQRRSRISWKIKKYYKFKELKYMRFINYENNKNIIIFRQFLSMQRGSDFEIYFKKKVKIFLNTCGIEEL